MPKDPIVLIKSMLLVPQDPAVVGGTGAPVLVVAWSLQYEIVFYAAVGLAIVHRMLFAGAALLMLLNMAWNLYAENPGFLASFFGNELTLLFAFGALAAWVVGSDRPVPKPASVAMWAAAVFFGIGVASEVFEGLPDAFVNMGFGLAASVLIVALVGVERKRPDLFRNKLLALIGDASYAMFLIHFPLIAVLC